MCDDRSWKDRHGGGNSIVKDGHNITVLAPGDEMIDAKMPAPTMWATREDIQESSQLQIFYEDHGQGHCRRKVTYTDEKGAENSIQADSIVIWSGLRPRMDEPKDHRFGDEVLLLGDCTGSCGRIHKTIRNAFLCVAGVIKTRFTLLGLSCGGREV
jgi:hypothetical protein